MLIHVFLDLENVQPAAADLQKIRGPHFRLWVLHGPHQKHFTADRVRAWQPLGEQVRFVQSAKAGPNALDLHVALCLGEAIEHDRRHSTPGCYLVVSKDRDFDALSGFLAGQGVKFGRAATVADVLKLADHWTPKAKPPSAATKAKPASSAKPALPTDLDRVLTDLRDHPKNRPTTRKRLENHVRSVLGNGVGIEQVARVIVELEKRSVARFVGTKVHYNLPKR